MVGGANPRHVVLASIRKQAEQAMGNKPVSSIPPWPLGRLLPPAFCPGGVPVLTFGDDEEWCARVTEISPFPCKLALVRIFVVVCSSQL